MKLGIISQWTMPGLSRIPLDIAKEHLKDGGTVKVLTSYPNYPHGAYSSKSDGTHSDVNDNGLLLRRIPSYIAKDGSARERIRSFLSFATSSLRYSGFLDDVDVVYVYATPMTTALAAIKLRLINRIPYVLHVQDIWPESVTDSGMIQKRFVRRIANAILNLLLIPVYRLASRVIVISPGAVPMLTSRGVNPSKIRLVFNWHAPPRSLETAHLDTEVTRDPVHIVYAGNIGHMQDLESLIRAAALIDDEEALRITIYGSGVQENAVRQLARQLNVANVHFGGQVDRSEMQQVYRDSDFQLVLLKKSRIFAANIPSKFQAALAHGRPIITTVAGDLAQICNAEGLGISAEPENPPSLAAALRRATTMSKSEIETMRMNAKRFYESNLTPGLGISSALEILTSCNNKSEGTI